MKNTFYITALFSAVVSVIIGCASRSAISGQEERTLLVQDLVYFQEPPDSVWRGIVVLKTPYGDMSGDFAVLHNDSLWTINVAGPFGVSLFQARKSYDSLEVKWKDESGVWREYRSWTENDIAPLVPFGELFFSLCVGRAEGEIVESREKSVFLIFEEILYAVLVEEETRALAVIEIEGEEYSFLWKTDGNETIKETTVRSSSFEAVFYFR